MHAIQRLDQLIHCKIPNISYQIMSIINFRIQANFCVSFQDIYTNFIALYCVSRNSLLYLFTHCEVCQYVVINRIGQEVDARETCVCQIFKAAEQPHRKIFVFRYKREKERTTGSISHARATLVFYDFEHRASGSRE